MDQGRRLSRRSFLELALLTGVGSSLGLAGCSKLSNLEEILTGQPRLAASEFPILSIRPGDLRGFSGDSPEHSHRLLLGGPSDFQNAPEEEAIVAVVGGGISGLAGAYFLKDLNPILLEQAKSLGGNSKGERWRNLSYTIGAAYIGAPDPGSQLEKFLKELDVWDRGRIDRGEDGGTVLHQGSVVSGFWRGATDPKRAQDFRRSYDVFKDVLDHGFPSIPTEEGGDLSPENFRLLDSVPFDYWMLKHLEPIHPHIAELLAEYFWSSFGGGVGEISAAQGLSFFAGELGGTMAFPGGNAAIAQALAERLDRALPPGHLRTSATVIDVTTSENGVRIVYADAKEKVKIIRAKACLVACPKFVAKRIMKGLPEDQTAAMKRIRYRAYLVANLLIKGRIPSPLYDLYRLTNAVPKNNAADSEARPFTDLTFGAWADSDRPDRSVLTLYRAYPFDDGANGLLRDDSFEKARAAFQSGIPDLLKSLKTTEDRIVDLRITRWGHPLPLAATGLIADGTLEKARSSFRDGKIVFANQDNWANPSFETALTSARTAAGEIRGALKG